MKILVDNEPRCAATVASTTSVAYGLGCRGAGAVRRQACTALPDERSDLVVAGAPRGIRAHVMRLPAADHAQGRRS
jgi:hypothetical protein